ncbi:hypothetical protein NIES2135_53600 [Leptolyngbya boryana NIES-2135]|jgi:Uma2 family endonuclease|uniref:Putative restriction endonuclease domain-containing protein n=1 Tax=Leptolyngbya boryana NIES-2135 TaxID=1973484 RepID=A0A1Z4JPA3_LEPBY|nr:MULTISPECIES: Uma2 family endonuclease [Leptolyngbya]BAY58487.1 hypothetical protein NIES2135_53600 [Leptolyngbya boryana NIES-2135]MBD2370962.1 Uma2 family endonuclease [Leptolyngbya sp. FACHB-161]MBD2377476.1 Uma2 family endonuclease [Leptolyngbya sp. FACHB-238]MBD2401884.1 Uma2 family endonuclease [Leptolyngbya sp. FACHB-239]MBD2408402.1 Uma2 family endonuclease [Leptolyngbya sp. FACHB-402]
MTQAKPRFRTIEEYLDYEDGTDTRYELVDGVLVEMPPERPINRRIASFLFGAFVRFGIPTDLLAIGTQIAITSRKVTAREPDFVVLTEECAIALEGARSDIIMPEMPAPALVVEVVSPGNPGSDNYDRDYVEKPREYAARGIPEFWQVDPTRAVVTVLKLEDGTYRTREFRGDEVVVSPVFPGLQLTAGQILRAGR